MSLDSCCCQTIYLLLHLVNSSFVRAKTWLTFYLTSFICHSKSSFDFFLLSLVSRCASISETRRKRNQIENWNETYGFAFTYSHVLCPQCPAVQQSFFLFFFRKNKVCRFHPLLRVFVCVLPSFLWSPSSESQIEWVDIHTKVEVDNPMFLHITRSSLFTYVLQSSSEKVNIWNWLSWAEISDKMMMMVVYILCVFFVHLSGAKYIN